VLLIPVYYLVLQLVLPSALLEAPRATATATNAMPSSRLTARAATSTYIVFALLCLPFTLPVMKVANQGLAYHRIEVPSDLFVMLVFPALIVLVFLWVSRFRILVSDSQLSYRTLFGGTRSLQLSQIVSARTEIGAGRSLGPFYRLIITPKDGTSPMVINMKIFSRTDLQKLFAILHDKVAGEVRLSIFAKTPGRTGRS
jgi:hypothetical protein